MSEQEQQQGKQSATETKQRLGPEAAILACQLAQLVALESLLVAEKLMLVAYWLMVLTVACIGMGVYLYWHRSANE